MEYLKVKNTDTQGESFMSRDEYNELSAREDINLEILVSGLNEAGLTPVEQAAEDALRAQELAEKNNI